jgi:hypothetical protein
MGREEHNDILKKYWNISLNSSNQRGGAVLNGKEGPTDINYIET